MVALFSVASFVGSFDILKCQEFLEINCDISKLLPSIADTCGIALHVFLFSHCLQFWPLALRINSSQWLRDLCNMEHLPWSRSWSILPL